MSKLHLRGLSSGIENVGGVWKENAALTKCGMRKGSPRIYDGRPSDFENYPPEDACGRCLAAQYSDAKRFQDLAR